MRRDLKPQRASRSRRRASSLSVGLVWALVLTAVNVAVVAYHGNPFAGDGKVLLADHILASQELGADDGSRQGAKPPSRILSSALGVFASLREPFLQGRGRDVMDHEVKVPPPPEPVARSPQPDLFVGPQFIAASVEPAAVIPRTTSLNLRSGQTLLAALIEAGANSDDASGAVASLQPAVDFRRLRADDPVAVTFDEAARLVLVELVQHGGHHQVSRTRRSAQWRYERIEIPRETVVRRVHGRIERSLWDTLIGQGEQPALISQIVDVFAWDLDFYSGIYPKDELTALVEKQLEDGELVGYGRILAARFDNHGVAHEAFLFPADGQGTYYDADGHSLRKMLLKTPLQYAPVTSGFGNRRHPVLGYTRRHNGVDYRASIGTPVWSVGDGRVLKAGWNGGFGRYVAVKHPNGWMSEYAHLSAIDVSAGQQVSQRQLVGRVGTSGMSTGPHLHFGLRKDGGYVNPAEQKFTRSRSLLGAQLGEFASLVQKQRQALAESELALLQ